MNKNTVVIFAGNQCNKNKRNKYFSLAYELGKNLALNGYIVANGAGQGLMNESLKGAFDAGGKTIGIGLSIENKESNPYAKRYQAYKDLKKRQSKLISLADYFIALPGGFGTAYEIFEIIALKRTGAINPKKPLILLGDFYNDYKNIFKKISTEGFLNKNESKDLFVFAKTVEQAINIIHKNGNS